MLKILLAIFLVFYVFSVSKAFARLAQIRKGIRLAEKFIAAYDLSFMHPEFGGRKYYAKRLESLLKYYPAAVKHLRTVWEPLSYNNPDYVNRENAATLCGDLMMVRNARLMELREALAGKTAVINIINFPCDLLDVLGLKPNSVFGKILVDIAGGLITFVLTKLAAPYLDRFLDYLLTVFPPR